MENSNLSPESLMMTYGYKPELSEGALKSPIFQTSTFVFKTAEEGKAYFELAYGQRDKNPLEEMGLIYSRLNNPNLEILENRLTLWDKADDCAVFESGMSAITTTLLEFSKPGDLVLHSAPVYGGTDHFIKSVLTKFDIQSVCFDAEDTFEEIKDRIIATGLSDKFSMIHIETPANPTNALIDIEMCRKLADTFSNEDKRVVLAVDNTYMGPIWSHPLAHGADLVLYSATKYIGGHSDVIAGACLGSNELIGRVKALRTFLGNMPAPFTSWLLMRSLETLKVRMECQAQNAAKVAEFLRDHPSIKQVQYLGFIDKDHPQFRIYQKQYESAGAMLSFNIEGGEKEAFKFLNSLKLIKLAVSLGSTESLAQHPASMTHCDVNQEDKAQIGISNNLVRISIGVENTKDIIWDIDQALAQVKKPSSLAR